MAFFFARITEVSGNGEETKYCSTFVYQTDGIVLVTGTTIPPPPQPPEVSNAMKKNSKLKLLGRTGWRLLHLLAPPMIIEFFFRPHLFFFYWKNHVRSSCVR